VRVAFGTAVGVAVGPAMTASADAGTNSVAYWCGSEDLGVKHEPVSTPFIVPAPPADTVWTKAIVQGRERRRRPSPSSQRPRW
jgi:hypothetical protein